MIGRCRELSQRLRFEVLVVPWDEIPTLLSEADLIQILQLVLLVGLSVIKGLINIVWGRFLGQVILGVIFVNGIQEVFFPSFEV